MVPEEALERWCGSDKHGRSKKKERGGGISWRKKSTVEVVSRRVFRDRWSVSFAQQQATTGLDVLGTGVAEKIYSHLVAFSW